MVAAKIDDQTFIEEFERLGPQMLADGYGYRSVRTVYERRTSLEKKYNRPIKAPEGPSSTRDALQAHPARAEISVDTGTVFVGSDSHYWPGIVSTSHRAFCKLAKELKPKAIIKNGDALDGASISRFSPIGWEDRPKLTDELDCVKERLAEIRDAGGPKCMYHWELGNHDARYETKLATVAPEYAKIHGVHLKDHFPWWEPSWSIWINDDVVVKHRFKGGIHATHNNTIWAGKTMVTGHLHSLKVTPFSDYNGTRWGVDCGTMADPYGPQFTDYTEDSPKNWREGFVILTFHKGKLLWPEVVYVIEKDRVSFRGEIIEV